MMDGTNPIRFPDVEVLAGGAALFLRCKIGDQIVRIPSMRRLPGTTIGWPGDRGVLVLEREFAIGLGLTQPALSTRTGNLAGPNGD